MIVSSSDQPRLVKLRCVEVVNMEVMNETEKRLESLFFPNNTGSSNDPNG